VFRPDILLQALTASSDKGSQVVLVLLGMIGALLIVSICMAGLFLFKRAISKTWTTTDMPPDAVKPARYSTIQKIGSVMLGGVILVGVFGAGFKAWKWAANKSAAIPVAVTVAPTKNPSSASSGPVSVAPTANTAVSTSVQMPVFAADESYTTIREKLISAGWAPFHAPDADTCSETDMRCKDRPEMKNCSGIGLAYCEFLWKKEGKLLRIYTADEYATFKGSALVADSPPAAASQTAKLPQ
jgi:hypothetical protein